MKISLNTLRFINQRYQSAGELAPDGAEALVEKIGSQLGAVEETINFGRRFEDVIIARVVSCQDHPDADRLHVCKLDDGGAVSGVERDEQGYVQVVCGAPNVREGLLVAWLPPGATVPESFDTDPFVLEARPLRGVVSNGMLASPRELSISDAHEGILEIADEHQPGTRFIDAYNLKDDVIIDIENKMFTHRPDCFGWLGVARELAGIQHQPYKSPDWYKIDAPIPAATGEILPLVVRNELPEEVPRFMAIAMSNISVKQSPLWLQIALTKVGIRPINHIVDLTNFFMLETGQPIHAYDYDKVRAQDSGADTATLVVRYPHENEKIVLLNGKEITPRDKAIMIATNDRLIGVGGVMGGADTEVDEQTKSIIIECAQFDMYSIRRTSMANGLFSDAVTRNNKGQSPLQQRAVLAKIVDEIQAAGGIVASELIDDNHLDVATRERGSLHPPVKLSREFINTRLGLDLSTQEMMMLLTNVEFSVLVEGDDLTVSAPFWRTDIEIPEDIVEEVGRLYGFDQLPLDLPRKDLTPAVKDPLYEIKARVRNILSSAGANEVLTYNFVHGDLLKKVGQSPEQAFALSNALSPDLQYMRMSLTPSLLDRVHMNIKAGHDSFALFEMNKAHNLLHAQDDEGLPTEFPLLSLVYTANDKHVSSGSGAAFYQARAYLDFLAEKLGLTLVYTPAGEVDYPIVKPFDIARSAMISVAGSDIILGMIGEFRASVRKTLKLPQHTAGFEISTSELLRAAQNSAGYTQLPRFPKVEQDICFKLSANVSYGELFDCIQAKLAEVQPEQSLTQISPVDIYQKQASDTTKQITFRVSVTSYQKTLRDEEISKLLKELAQAAREAFEAEVV